MILKKPDINHYNISDHLEFHVLSYKICSDYAAQIDAPALITDYHDALKQEEQVYRWLRKSEFTAKKAETDYTRDKILRNMAAIVRTNMKHFDPAVRNRALHVHNLLESYDNATKADYDAETADIDSLITRLQSSDYQEAVATLGLCGWINELEHENVLFKSYVSAAAQEKLAKPKTAPRVARRQTDNALRSITTRIASLVVLNGQDNYAGFISRFNVLVSHYNTLMHEHYGRLHARIDITPSIIEMIPVQQYTGEPVFVIPKLTLTMTREGKQLVLHPLFSEDFLVTYRNNVEPGTATLIIRGIGKYTGEITTTFSITHTSSINN
jgi:hypothetical protein